MVKLITLFNKKAGVSDEDFYRYWREKHGPLAIKVMAGVRKMVQNYPIKLPGFVYPADGIVEAWFDNVDTYLRYYAWRQSDEGKVLLNDEETFIDKSKFIRFIVEEHEVKNEVVPIIRTG